jgi:hypothetical protein
VGVGLSIFQYDDDAILFIGLKLILAIFEQLWAFKIKFHKRELFFLGEPRRGYPLC